MHHNLKLNEKYANAKSKGEKLFEIRFYGDRKFSVGDTVSYKIVNDKGIAVSHKLQEKTFQITYISDFMQKENYIVFGEKEVCKCPLGGDETNDCEDCVYSCDYHFADGECIEREFLDTIVIEKKELENLESIICNNGTNDALEIIHSLFKRY